ncbi:heme oxygenase [Paenibacillus sp. Root52]|uniref:biliverdin-producing heme oxygenase n=1 Tax=Paenibacillus sp. Root52 TaxID=1736552 RepID=UPI0006FD0DD4|nr:biliverdin-producing heme oxygenase [Paenibacillus sp. Root52]KQY94845.1 heme oxygenase [Paenibacillus sp. Root52]
MTTSNLMERLKTETAHYHRQIELNPYAKAIMNQTISLGEYKQYLEKFYGFIKQIEEQAVNMPFWNNIGLDIEVRGKTALLENDLRNLGSSEEDIRNLPLCEQLPEISSPAQLFGYFYVIEGSTNGGQIMTKRLSQFLPIEADRGLAYFNAYGEDTRTRWKEFMELLLQSVSKTEEHDEMVHTSSETFRLLDQWINTAD